MRKIAEFCRKCSCSFNCLERKAMPQGVFDWTRSGQAGDWGVPNKGMWFVENRLDTWPRVRPEGFYFYKWIPERPRYMHHTTYRRHLRRFLWYRKRHEAREIRDMLRILEMVKEMEL